MDEIEKIKEVLRCIKLAHDSKSHLVFHAVMSDGDIVVKKIIKPLEKISNWSEKDEEKTRKMIEEINRKSSGNLKEKFETIKKILKESEKEEEI